MSVPENHVTGEGRNLRAALEDAAAKLGVPPAQVEHKIDMAHFRNAAGAGIGVDTVRIFAWAKDPVDLAPVTAAETWMKGLLTSMEREGTVRADRRGGAVVVFVDVGEAGRHLVGRGGATLRSIQHLLEASVGAQFPGVQFRIDIARSEEERRDDRPRDRDDRPRDRDDRPRDRDDRPRDRDDRPRDRDRDRGDRGGRDRRRRDDDRPRRSDSDGEELKRLARKIAERVRSTGEAETIRRELNSYDRRLVHMEVATIEGVASRSIGEGHDRRIEIHLKTDGDAESAE